jgi:hypothetical protein
MSLLSSCILISYQGKRNRQNTKSGEQEIHSGKIQITSSLVPPLQEFDDPHSRDGLKPAG